MMSAAWGKEMRSYLIIFCLVLAITSVVTALEAPVVTGITPQGGANSSAIAITNLAGINFTSGAAVMLTPGTVRPTHKGSLSNSFLMSPRSVFVSGNYAYVSSVVSNSLEIADITNPAYPVHMGSISHGTGGALLNLPFKVYVSGNYAYVASYGSNALEIINVINRSAPVHVSSISNAFLVNPQSVYVAGDYAYVASYGSHMLEIVDVTNPASPVHTNNLAIDTPTSVFVAGNYAYVTSSRGDSLEIVDVTNPASPVRTGGISNTYLSNPQSVYVSGNYAYVTGYDSNSLVIVDIRNPAAPVISGRITHGGGALLSQPFSVFVSGNYAYVASSNSNALEIIDVTNPASPVHKGYLANGGSTLLSYPVSVYVAGNYAYVASLSSNALEIVDIGTVTATGVNVVSPNRITCTLNLVDKTAGLYNVVVTNPDGNFGVLSNGFTISASGIPAAGFSGTPRSGASPLTVSFTDSSFNTPTSWNWSFGDGSFSTLQHPVHTFTRGGAYSISLTATNGKGSNTLTRPDYIVVDGAQTGVFRASSGNWYMDYNNTGVVDRSFHFGATSDIPVVADWNADGITDAGVFRPSNGNWYLNYFSDPIVDTAFQFGKNGDIPVTGDWDEDGTSDAGVFRPSSGTWYLDTTKTGVVYRSFQFGKNGDIPVTGDWDGDGTSDAGVFRPSSGTWYLDTTKTGVVYRSFQFGKNGDIAVAGDWHGNGSFEAGVFRPSNGNWYLNYYNNGTVNKGYLFGKAGDVPQAGKWFTTNLVPIDPVAAFTSNVQTGTTPLSVQFTDLSTTNVRLTYAWDFNNDGTIDSTQKNPSNVFTAVGNYTVSLTVTNTAGSDTLIRTNYITVNPVPVAPVANFTATPRNGPAPLLVSFTDTSTGTITSWLWEYQNATVGWTQFSATNNPSTSFPTGIYDIRLTVSGPAGSSNRTETGYITVTAPAITLSPTDLSPVYVNIPYNQLITASGGTAPYTFSNTSALPTGLSLSAGGTISGTPTATGTRIFTIIATDANTFNGSRIYSLTINPQPTITLSPTDLSPVYVNIPYSQLITASGGTAPYTFSNTSALPTGLSLSAGGTISGTPTVTGTRIFTVIATDANTFNGSGIYSLTINPQPTISLLPASLPDANVSIEYSQQITASGGTAPYTFSNTSALPTGLSLSPGGTISGTPTAMGAYDFAINATDAESFVGSRPYTLVVNP